MNNLIDHRVSHEKLDSIRKSKTKKQNFFGVKALFSLFVVLSVVSGTFYYFSNAQKVEAVEFGLGNDYEEVLKINEQFSNNVPFSIDSIAIANEQGDKRVVALLLFLQKYNSPMASPSVAKAFIDGADNNGFSNNWHILPAIAGIESAFGKLIPHNGKYPSYNAWGWSGGSKYGRWSYFESWEDAATKVSAGIAKGYARTGYDPEKMMRTYCPPCARPESGGIWAKTVNKYIDEMKSIHESL